MASTNNLGVLSATNQGAAAIDSAQEVAVADEARVDHVDVPSEQGGHATSEQLVAEVPGFL
ncbi:MAG: hypothetical protein Q8M25_06715 [Rhodoferax sp.]|nr:hypothetical protein [Rhodoferax sp.]